MSCVCASNPQIGPFPSPFESFIFEFLRVPSFILRKFFGYSGEITISIHGYTFGLYFV